MLLLLYDASSMMFWEKKQKYPDQLWRKCFCSNLVSKEMPKEAHWAQLVWLKRSIFNIGKPLVKAGCGIMRSYHKMPTSQCITLYHGVDPPTEANDAYQPPYQCDHFRHCSCMCHNPISQSDWKKYKTSLSEYQWCDSRKVWLRKCGVLSGLGLHKESKTRKRTLVQMHQQRLACAESSFCKCPIKYEWYRAIFLSAGLRTCMNWSSKNALILQPQHSFCMLCIEERPAHA